MNTIQNMDAWRDSAIEALGAVKGITFQPRPGGETFTVPHPMILTDEENEETDRTVGTLAIASALLGGPDVYARFAAAGGRAGDVMMAWRMMQQGVSLDPNSSAFTPSSAAAPTNSSPTSNTITPASIAPSISGGELSSPVPAS